MKVNYPFSILNSHYGFLLALIPLFISLNVMAQEPQPACQTVMINSANYFIPQSCEDRIIGPMAGAALSFPIKTIGVNVHFIQDEFGGQNFRAPGVTDPNGVVDGVQAAQAMVDAFNDELSNMPMATCPGLNGLIPDNLIDTRFRFELYTEQGNSSDQYDGVWFHADPNFDNIDQFDHSTLETQYSAYNSNTSVSF